VIIEAIPKRQNKCVCQKREYTHQCYNCGSAFNLYESNH